MIERTSIFLPSTMHRPWYGVWEHEVYGSRICISSPMKISAHLELQAGRRARHLCERGRAPEAVLQQKLGRNVAGGPDDEDSGVRWRRVPDLLALDQKAERLERTTGKRNL